MHIETNHHQMSPWMKIRLYLNKKNEFKRWEIAKYALASLCIFLPGLGRFIHYFTYPCLFTFIAFFCMCFGLLMLFKISRKWLTPFIIIGISGLAYQLAIGKPLGYQTLTAMYETNHREMLGFLSSPYSIPLIAGGLSTLGALLWLIVGEKPLPLLHKHTFIRRKYLLPFLIVSIVLFAMTHWRIRQTYPICLFYNNFMYIDENITIDEYIKSSYKCPDDYLTKNSADETFMLIIGEAARRTSLSAYGYPRGTSPELDEMLKTHPGNIVLYSDAISTAAFTKASAMSIYSPLTVPEELNSVHTKPGMSKIFNGSGFSTLYITTRPKYALRNMLSTFLDDASKTIYLTTLTKKAFDEETIPVISDYIRRTSGRKLIILHLMGSHIEYAAQYPKSFSHFRNGNHLVDTYDDSIRYSDHVIKRIASQLLLSQKPAFMMYISDHGENLNDMKDNNYGHGTRALTQYELRIPFIVYMNDAFIGSHIQIAGKLRERKSQPVSHDNIVHTFMGIAGISDPYVYRSDLDISSSDFKTGIRYITDENMNPFDYDTFDFSKKDKLTEIKKTLAEEYRSKFTW
ncbi:MAG: phosphoethanolamine transferase [Victivallales bacterium]